MAIAKRGKMNTSKALAKKAELINSAKKSSILFCTFSSKSADELNQKWLKVSSGASEVILDENQMKVINAILQTNNNIAVQATAGSGKTTTAIAIPHYLKLDNPIILNNHKIASRLNLLKDSIGKYKIDKWKYHNILGDLENNKSYLAEFYDYLSQQFEEDDEFQLPNPFQIKTGMIKGIDLLRSRLCDLDNIEECYETLTKYEIDVEGYAYTCTPWICKIIKETLINDFNNDDIVLIDFTDMLYYSVIGYQTKGIKSDISFDYIIVDEAQDTSPLDLALYHIVSNKDTKYIFFGQTEQTIYGFRGIEVTNYKQIIQQYSCEEFYLPISYRNPKCINELSKKYCDYHDIYQNNGDGNLRILEYDDIWNYIKENDTILCAYNAPIIALALKGLEKNFFIEIKNHDLLDDLVSIIKRISKHPKYSYSEFLFFLEEYFYRKIQIAKKYYPKGLQADILQDKWNCLIFCYKTFAFCVNCVELVAEITQLFEQKGKVKAMSIHASKGMEFETIFILDWDRANYIGKSFTETDILNQRYRNFVGLTRIKWSKDNPDSGTLYLVNSRLE